MKLKSVYAWGLQPFKIISLIKRANQLKQVVKKWNVYKKNSLTIHKQTFSPSEV